MNISFSKSLLLTILSLYVNVQLTFAQAGLKDLINARIDQYRNIPSKPVDSIASPTDSVAIDIVDAVDAVDVSEVEERPGVELSGAEIKNIDTTSFVRRALSVKKRKPVRDFKNQSEWDRYFRIEEGESYKKEHVLEEEYQVFGWHPYWMGSAYEDYNYSLLSVLAYFSYELNPRTGGYQSIHDWKTTHVVDSAQAHGTKVLLSVTNFGGENNKLFLSNHKAQKKFIVQLISLLKERNADGVNIDFENIYGSLRNELTEFIIDLSNSLKMENDKYMITLALPPIDYSNVYDFKQINQYVDLYVIMGYEFYGVNSSVAGPVAPLESGDTWWDYNLQRAIEDYELEGIPLKKTLMGLPYYGAEWQTESLKFPSTAKKFIKYPMYRDVKNKYGDLPCCEDEGSKSKYYVYRDEDNEYRQLWYEDSISLGKKYDWIKESKLGGVGIWALGYDNGHDELWKLIALKFAKESGDAAISNMKTFFQKFSPRRLLGLVARVAKNPASLLQNPRPLMGMFGMISGVSLLGFFVMYRYGHRISRTFGVVIKGSIVMGVLLVVALVFVGMKFMSVHFMLYLTIGLLIGGGVMLLLSRKFLREKDLP
ncbi:glycosyl hydrolase family 18 protein [Reichenbachiella carrageenanivorans]|uniref:Glycosyl hydrolase family 18 protein n=1 Tax=Reichenbachiella carrageenanivorans TaxID=2979869 RepID=A0ABY6CUX7_9BACT|nr:glycosyl hydrolase family 18 protein [Reichenbachiella carrageenanivorans]UXX77726.1 glycosyl hydrolase family 18 protein [Reichenbachiella carrageenanivorans]